MVFADGILLSNYLGNGPTNAPRWMLVTPEEIERVDVLYGPFSAAYAGNSVGAVVDYVTRMPTKFEAHGKVGYGTSPSGCTTPTSTYGGKQVSASVGNKNGDWAWFLNFNRTDSEGQPLTFPTRLVSAGTVGSAGTPVTGAVRPTAATRPWYFCWAPPRNTTPSKTTSRPSSPTTSIAHGACQLHLGLVAQHVRRAPHQSYLRDAAGNAGVQRCGQHQWPGIHRGAHRRDFNAQRRP
jgi:iron complex outermembrane receptor protein